MKFRVSVALFACVALCVTSAVAQDHGSDDVRADRVVIGPQFIPRDATGTRLIVPAGETKLIPADSTWDYVEVAGILKRDPDVKDTTLRATTVVVLPGGDLEVGTKADPLPADATFTLIIRDSVIDTTKDPFQWSHGLVNFGRRSTVGAAKRVKTTAVGDIAQGATSLTLADDPTGWKVGDELLIPDTAQIELGPADGHPPSHRRESPVMVAGIAGRVVTLSKPLDFEHNRQWLPELRDRLTNAMVRPRTVLLLPRVVNLSRNLVIKSENPKGTKGHTVNIGHMAKWDIEYTEVRDMGRTLSATIDETVGTHIGTNVKAKYAEHDHHADGFGSEKRGNVYRGGEKWGMVIHGTSDGVYEDNVAIDFKGAGIVTEDGYEHRYVLRNNFSAYINPLPGTAANVPGVDKAEANFNTGCPGCEGAGYWLHSVNGVIEFNEVWNSATGFNFFNVATVGGSFASVPGGAADTVYTNAMRKMTVPLSAKGNVASANTVVNVEYWGMTLFPNVDLVAAYSGGAQLATVVSDPMGAHFVNPTFISDGSGHAYGMKTGKAYTFAIKLEGGEISGNEVGVTDGAQAVSYSGTTFANLRDEIYTPDRPTFGVTYASVTRYAVAGTAPNLAVTFGTMNDTWEGIGPPPLDGGVTVNIQQRDGSPFTSADHQRSGKNYRLLFPTSEESRLAVPSTDDTGTTATFRWGVPERGLTNRQAWDKYGIGRNGDIFKASEALKLPEFAAGDAPMFAQEGSAPARPTRIVMTWPTMAKAAVVNPATNSRGPFVDVYDLLTGPYQPGEEKFVMSVDGGPWEFWWQDGKTAFQVRSYVTTPGTHTVRTRALTRDDVQRPETEMVAQYFIGDAPVVVPPVVTPPVVVPPVVVPPVVVPPVVVPPVVVPDPLRLSTCLADIRTNANAGTAGKVVTFDLPVASGGVAPLTVTARPRSGSVFPLGSTTVTVSGRDAAGSVVTCTFAVVVDPFVEPPKPTKKVVKVRVIYDDGTFDEFP